MRTHLYIAIFTIAPARSISILMKVCTQIKWEEKEQTERLKMQERTHGNNKQSFKATER